MRETGHLEDLTIDGTIIIKWGGMGWIDLA
jgi:hypothetical protein